MLYVGFEEATKNYQNVPYSLSKSVFYEVVRECGSQQSSQLLLQDSNKSKIEDLESPECIYVIYYV